MKKVVINYNMLKNGMLPKERKKFELIVTRLGRFEFEVKFGFIYLELESNSSVQIRVE